MNILFYLTPKSMCAYLEDKSTLRQALERMEVAGYAALPILNEKGEYCGTLTEGDMLWAVKNLCGMDLRQTENHRIMEIAHRRDNVPVSVTTSMQDLINRASEQNFVPVIGDTPGHYALLPANHGDGGLRLFWFCTCDTAAPKALPGGPREAFEAAFTMQSPSFRQKTQELLRDLPPFFLLPGHGLGPVHSLQKSGHLPTGGVHLGLELPGG